MATWKKAANVDQPPQENREGQRPDVWDKSSGDETKVFEEGLLNMLGKDVFQKIKEQAMRENKSIKQVFQEHYDKLCDLAELGIVHCQCHPDGSDKYILP